MTRDDVILARNTEVSKQPIDPELARKRTCDRTLSVNRKLARALVRLAPESLQFSEISFRGLPLYSYDYDADYPEVGQKFKAV